MVCNCGRTADSMKVYFHRQSGLRVTVCNDCEKEKILDKDKNFYSKEPNELTAQDNKTPDPNGKN